MEPGNSTSRESCVFLWSDRGLFLGPRSTTTPHAHHAVEICIPLDDSIDMRAHPEGVALVRCPGAVVLSGNVHALTIWGPRVAIIYVEPHSRDGRALHARFTDTPIAALDATAVDGWRQAFKAILVAPSLERADAECARVIDELVGELRGAAPASDADGRPLEPRVIAAMQFIVENLDRVVSTREIAQAVKLSDRRLRHLFREHLGMPVRRYALWIRLRYALMLALGGHSLTDCAHEAGFSDAAHFTRTCRQMFGMAPSGFAPVDELFVAPLADAPSLRLDQVFGRETA